ncbi:MAG TPA: UDP-N-acetylglucosamine 1-carboxyvinyltransferase [Herpetosiphonaceae bacterium]
MESFVIEGGQRLSGTITPTGNKNAALPLLAVALLTDEPIIYRNMPNIGDVRVKLKLLADLGVEVEWLEHNTLKLHARDVRGSEPDPELCARIRTSILLAAPLLVRTGRAVLARPGGDSIGHRRLDTHFLALRTLGAAVTVTNSAYDLSTAGLRGAELFLDEMSVTGTEQAVIAAVLAEGETIISNAASEPHVQDVCRCLAQMGAQIDGIGTNTLRIRGVAKLGSAEFTLGPDYMEVGSYIGLAAVTGSALRIANARPQEHRMTRIMFGRLGVRWEDDGPDIVVPGDQELRVQDDLHGVVPKIDDSPWPGFPPDLMSIALVLATQSHGTVLIHQKMFDGRLFFVDKLLGMGARIILCDPHRAVVVGPAKLFGEKLTSPDIRAGMALVIAALCATGTSVISNIAQIDRGYERIDERLAALGARITRRSDAK